jgi:triacylglycerol lipase
MFVHQLMRKFIIPLVLGSTLTIKQTLAETIPAKAHVVLVHGIFQKGYSFLPMQKKLQAQGFDCLIPSLKPADARSGIDVLAQQLDREINAKWGDNAEVHIVAHSMGGLVSRYYLQELGGAKKCKTLITLATPHHGTNAAYCYPGTGAIQMRPGSEFLQNLEKTSNRLQGIRILSYRTPLDLIILPSTSSHWDLAENHRIWVPAHPLVMHAPRVQREIIATLQSATSAAGQIVR